MRKYARKDANQDAIVAALRGIGASVQSLASVGNGCPDLLVGFCGTNYLMEIKDGSKPASARKLTADEKKWHENWQGSVWKIHSVAEALAGLGVETDIQF